jgi:hypothetical protein
MALVSPYSNNRPTPASDTAVGFKISKPGYDARRTAGSNFVFNSSWPSLPIAFETTITNPITSTSATATINHKLGFVPFAIVWTYGPDASGIATTTTRLFMNVDANNLYLNTTNLNLIQQATITAATKLTIRCFQLDITKDIDYALAPGDTFNMPYDPNFGIKVVKPNKDINSLDMRDYALHSRCQSPLILAVKTQDTVPAANIAPGGAPFNVIQYTNKFTTPVWVYGYVKLSSGQYQYVPYYSQASPKTRTDGLVTYIEYATASFTGASLVILRDPMFAATSTTVQY